MLYDKHSNLFYNTIDDKHYNIFIYYNIDDNHSSLFCDVINFILRTLVYFTKHDKHSSLFFREFIFGWQTL